MPRPTIRSVASGNWSAPSTWNPARVPGADDKVLVGSGTNVTYDAISDASLDCVSVEGALRFRNNANTRIKVGNLMVKDNGTLEVGTSASPIPAGVTAEIIIADKPLDTNFDPEQFGTGFIGFGRVIMHGAIKSPTFTRLTTEPMAGATTLNLAEAPAGWAVGDKVLIPDTRQLKYAELQTNFEQVVGRPGAVGRAHDLARFSVRRSCCRRRCPTTTRARAPSRHARLPAARRAISRAPSSSGPRIRPARAATGSSASARTSISATSRSGTWAAPPCSRSTAPRSTAAAASRMSARTRSAAIRSTCTT